MQTSGRNENYVPADYSQSVWDITKRATEDGIIVVAAAGNGNENLDDSYYSRYIARGDNGSIIVGAGSADVSRKKLYFSTYGSRVNVQGWGEAVTTTGYGTRYNGGEHATYANEFAGTSSATPIVASAVVAIQSYAKNKLGIILTPREMRSLLIETGRAQGSGGHIGPLPDVKAAIEKLNETYSARLHIVSNIDDTILYTESELILQWTGKNHSGPISLQLLNSRNKLLLISDDISPDTQYSWFINSDINTGDHYRLVISHSDASDTSGFFTIMRRKPDQNTVLLDQTDISVAYVSNQGNDTGNGAATNVLDNRTNTIWYTKSYVNHPHSIILKTSTAYGISGLSYTRSNEDIYGIITDYRIEISADSISWDTVAFGKWNADSMISPVRFDATWGNYVRLTSLTSENGSLRASAAQIHLYIEPEYKRDQSIAFAAISDTLTYGDPPFLLEAIAKSGLPVIFTSSNSEVIRISSDSAYIKGAGTVIITVSQSGNDSWKKAKDVKQTLTVLKAPLSIRADDATKGQGRPDPKFTVTCDGFVDGESFSVLGGTLRIDRTPEGEEPGEYQIIPSGVTSNNYEIVFVNGTLTIEPKISVRYPVDSKRGQNGRTNSSPENFKQSEQNLCSIIFFKNPVDLSSKEARFRVKVPCQAVLKIVIYDASGDMLDSRSVCTNHKGESGVLTWDLRNRNGSRVSVGTYLVQVAARGLKAAESYRVRGKLGVSRREKE